MIKRLICLANSRKLGGRCIAGRELIAGNPGEWIRPVGEGEDGEVSRRERQYEDGSDPRVLDIIDVPLIGPRSKPHQPENWLLDRGAYWSKVGEFGHGNLHLLADTPGRLWTNGHHTSDGQNDYVLVEEANEASSSLALIAVDGLQLKVYTREFYTHEYGLRLKRKVQAAFSLGGESYRLQVTDPHTETEYLAQTDGTYPLGSSYLTISLSEPFKGCCYKLVAAIIRALP